MFDGDPFRVSVGECFPYSSIGNVPVTCRMPANWYSKRCGRPKNIQTIIGNLTEHPQEHQETPTGQGNAQPELLGFWSKRTVVAATGFRQAPMTPKPDVRFYDPAILKKSFLKCHFSSMYFVAVILGPLIHTMCVPFGKSLQDCQLATK